MLAGWNNVTAFVEAKCVCVSIKIPNFPDPKVTSSNSNKVWNTRISNSLSIELLIYQLIIEALVKRDSYEAESVVQKVNSWVVWLI